MQALYRHRNRRLIASALQGFELDLILGHGKYGGVYAGQSVMVAKEKLQLVAGVKRLAGGGDEQVLALGGQGERARQKRSAHELLRINGECLFPIDIPVSRIPSLLERGNRIERRAGPALDGNRRGGE